MNQELETNDITIDYYISEQFSTINDSLTLFKMQINSLQKHVKNVEKDIKKQLKTMKKNIKNDKPKNARAPSGFAKPTKVTKELCEFMNKPEGSEIARTEVTKALVSYIKNNNLIELGIDTKNKIIPDEKLKNLLGIQEKEINDLTYFNIQKYMNKHFYSKKQQKTGLTLDE
jgi:predicted ATP-grasp superfamily ATP-dependent carboligase